MDVVEWVSKQRDNGKGVLIMGMDGCGRTLSAVHRDNVFDYPKLDVESPFYPMKDYSEILKKLKEYDFVLCPLDLKLMRKFVLLKHPLILVYPKHLSKETYLSKMKDRLNKEKSIQYYSDKWDEFYTQLALLFTNNDVFHYEYDPRDFFMDDLMRQLD